MQLENFLQRSSVFADKPHEFNDLYFKGNVTITDDDGNSIGYVRVVTLYQTESKELTTNITPYPIHVLLPHTASDPALIHDLITHFKSNIEPTLLGISTDDVNFSNENSHAFPDPWARYYTVEPIGSVPDPHVKGGIIVLYRQALYIQPLAKEVRKALQSYVNISSHTPQTEKEFT